MSNPPGCPDTRITSNGYVEVESVRFTGSQMGISTDADIITLSSGAVAVSGTLTVSDDLKLSETSAALTHTASIVAITSTAGYVDVESVRYFKCHRHQR